MEQDPEFGAYALVRMLEEYSCIQYVNHSEGVGNLEV